MADRLKFWLGDGRDVVLLVGGPDGLDATLKASADETLECVLCRSDGQAVAVNMDIEPVEKPETVLWIDPTHPHGGV